MLILSGPLSSSTTIIVVNSVTKLCFKLKLLLVQWLHQCWWRILRQNVLVSSLRCWWPICYIEKVTNIMKKIINMILPAAYKTVIIIKSSTKRCKQHQWCYITVTLSKKRLIDHRRSSRIMNEPDYFIFNWFLIFLVFIFVQKLLQFHISENSLQIGPIFVTFPAFID